jgi:hypothetical protein
MQAPAIAFGDTPPSRDGEVKLYLSPEGMTQSWFNPARRVIFVNGMDNTPEDHMEAAMAVSLMQGCPVIGVFNKSNGKWSDLGQCIADKAQLSQVQAGVGLSFDNWMVAVEAMYQLARKTYPMLQKTDFVGALVEGNAATRSLYGLLAGDGGVSRARTPIYCHSQGNLITSNALTAVAMALGGGALAGVEVNSFGSPCRFWPPNIKRHNHAFTLDPVSWLDLAADMSSAKIGHIAGHAFKLYMLVDAEFVVNRFRFGGLSMTASMDEEGLAAFLVQVGGNAQRVRRIFEHLRNKHFTDSDDVALAYVQAAPMALLQSLKRADPGLIALLIGLLKAGWTADDEKAAIVKLLKL